MSGICKRATDSGALPLPLEGGGRRATVSAAFFANGMSERAGRH